MSRHQSIRSAHHLPRLLLFAEPASQEVAVCYAQLPGAAKKRRRLDVVSLETGELFEGLFGPMWFSWPASLSLSSLHHHFQCHYQPIIMNVRAIIIITLSPSSFLTSISIIIAIIIVINIITISRHRYHQHRLSNPTIFIVKELFVFLFICNPLIHSSNVISFLNNKWSKVHESI